MIEKDDEKSDYYTFNLTGIETRRLPMLKLANHNELEKRLYGEEYYFMEANRDGI